MTYAANWYREFDHISFWDDLDFIGIQGYFPLSTKHHPTTSALIKAWQKPKKAMARVAKKYGKKIILTEVGYKNTSDSAIEPWTWPQQLDSESVSRSDQTQLNCYEALFDALWPEPWMEGVFIWKWYHSTYQYLNFEDYYTARAKRRRQYARRRNRPLGPLVDFSPQRTITLDFLKSKFKGS